MPEPNLPPLGEPEISETEPCSSCGGSGALPGGNLCVACAGTGVRHRNEETTERDW